MKLIEQLRKSKLVFPCIILMILACGAYLLNANEGALTNLVFTVFTLLVWIVGLCLHEFAHAYSAFRFGDVSVEEKGYLTLNPLLYGDFITSFLFPILILMIGGLPLPGGAVYLNHHTIGSKFKIMLTYLCGPFANLVFALVLAIVFHILENQVPQTLSDIAASGAAADASANTKAAVQDYLSRMNALNAGELMPKNNDVLVSAIALAIYLQIYTAIFNLLPVPSFDGYGAISTWFGESLRAAIRPFERFAMWGLILAFFYAPQIFQGLQIAAILPMLVLGVDLGLVDTGFGFFLGRGN